jgi:pimeloyl-ACP methyl ester carboxylesterase
MSIARLSRCFTLRAAVAMATVSMAAVALLGVSASAIAAPFESGRITVRAEGSGPDVVLIPGLNSSPRVWTEMVKAVPGYRYHLVQVSGFAGQPKDGNLDGPVAAPVAEEIDRYIKESGLKQPVVIGHSMGGTIGMMLAARHPGDLSKLMVVDMVPFLGMFFGGPGASVASVEPIADRIAAGMRAASPDERSKRAVDTINSMVNTESMRPAAIDDSMRSHVDVGTRAYRELVVTNLGPELPKISVPVTVLYVQPKSVPMPAEQFDAVYKGMFAPVPQLTLKRVPDSAHFIMWDQPVRFQAEVKGFLASP